MLNCRNFGKKRQIISYLEIRRNVITESGRIGIKPITYLLLGCSTGGVEDEVPEGEAVALLCLRDEDRLWRGPSGNHGAYESLVTVTLLKREKKFLKNFETLRIIVSACTHCKRNFIILIHVCQTLLHLLYVILHLHTQNGHKVLLVQNRTKLKLNRSYLIYA